MKVPSKLLERVTEDDQEALEYQFNNCNLLREAIVSHLTREIEITLSTASSNSLYMKPSWAYQQADLIGQRRALESLINIIKGNQEVNNKPS